MLRYRALLVDPGTVQERPIQIMGNDRARMDEWAAIVLKKAKSPDATVEIYETTESKVATITKEVKQ